MHFVNLTMGEIKTLAYSDLEATGLSSSGRPRISKLSLVAVNIEDILELKRFSREGNCVRHFEDPGKILDSF